MEKEILDFYKQTSCFTDLGLYKEFAKKLPNDIKELCLLQKHQIIHPFIFKNADIRNKKDTYWGDMTEIPIYKLQYENDMFPTAQAMFAELLRRDKNYSHNRRAKDKIHVCCREQSILLTATLKAKGYSARCRSGFAYYVAYENTAGDHWITEYYDEEKQKWILVDADMQEEPNIDFDINNIPRDKFVFGAENMQKKKFIMHQIHLHME